MYNTGALTPAAMGVGAGASLPFLEMSPLWWVLAAFALIACGSAVLRVLPRMVVEGQDWPGSRSAEAARQAPDHR
ncbi:hypothetical protein ACFQ34_26635 [Pseudonocardia benzenivorans]|jgi:hypothetical protein|nr:hypothetical protein [Pseudonocardia dioxanivorans]GJF05369.1 hypothetical protein PSD17_43210 [Pseudonocardia sp. D17]